MKRTCISQETNRTMAKDEYSKKLETAELKETIFVSTMLLTRASIVDLLKHLHPSHFSIRMIYNGYTTCVQKWAMILKAVAKISTHLSLPRKEKNRVPPKQELLTLEDLDKGKRFLIRQISTRFLLTQNQTCVDSLNTVAKVLKPTWLKSIRTWTSSESSSQNQDLRS